MHNGHSAPATQTLPRPGHGDLPATQTGHGDLPATQTLPRPSLGAAELLAAWDEASAQPPARRAIRLLAAGWPGTPSELWLRGTVGDRDARLLSLREELFGHQLEVVARCPSCGESLEVELRTDDVRAPAPPGGRLLCVEAGGCRVEGHLPTSADLIEVGGLAPEEARAALLSRCIEVAQRGGGDVDAAALPADVTQALARAMAEADPQADMNLSLSCPACQHRWSMPFDILSYLWDEVEDWARRLLREVHALASAYGWSERDILGMSARRRRLYLELSGGPA